MNSPILITGCQRSGTTLLNLILDSHPKIIGIDEMEFDKIPFNDYLTAPQFHPYVSFKLPTDSHRVQFIKNIPRLKVLWCIRDPRDVVFSMLNLKLYLDQDVAVPWAVHPFGSWREIDNCAKALINKMGPVLFDHYTAFKKMAQKHPKDWSLEQAVFTAALCWRIKHEVLTLYKENNISHKILNYENLITEPKETISNILFYIGLPWHDNVLKHHLLHTGTSVGNTINSRPIDSSNSGKWKKSFNAHLLYIINLLCSDIAERYGYRLSAEVPKMG